jgi:hypothetical protein
VTQDELDLMQDALLLLHTANQHSHTVMWQKAKTNVLVRGQDLTPQPGDAAHDVYARLRFLSNGE